MGDDDGRQGKIAFIKVLQAITALTFMHTTARQNRVMICYSEIRPTKVVCNFFSYLMIVSVICILFASIGKKSMRGDFYITILLGPLGGNYRIFCCSFYYLSAPHILYEMVMCKLIRTVTLCSC